MYTRGEFEQRRRAKERAQRRAAVPLLIGSVGLGVAQLLFITWADRRWARPAARLSDLSERVAAATGRCDACGAQVIA